MSSSTSDLVCQACNSIQEVSTARFCRRCGAKIAIHDSLRKAFRTAFYVHTALFVGSALILDGGRLHRLCLVSMLGFWIGVLAIVCRRGRSLTRTDFWFIRYGVVVLWLLSPYVAAAVYRYIGESPLSGIERFFGG